MKTTLTLIALLASLAACFAPERDLPALITSTIISREIYGEFKFPQAPDSPGAIDHMAFSPTEAQWIKMSKWVKARSHCKDKDYINEAWDCDDMAREWVYLTHRWAVENFTKTDPFPISTYAVSVIVHDGFGGLELSRSTHHMMGLIRMSNGVWFFFDPQNDLRVPVIQSVFGEGNVEIKKVQW
jgi:hypothetical protein